ncbi:hypothetical protein SCHPADRAFT_943300 [Schizopora paradoxa]|uniref:HTH APSES-type domain-containing protein n=1 Tax=Schizopora paradoxa TaxID=27342 RepID=A0A0H2REE8_9AGAM|nr:hypothetical protein SCHPADRAFT_943300 [Schizopora paradoxa]
MAHWQANGNHVAPKTNTPRPPLPHTHVNPYLLSPIDNAKTPAVKYQVITREGQEIVVGRVKIQTPGGGHAFVLRRFDTGAISLTTMFRAAFPSAHQDTENTENQWVKANFDNRDTNGSGKDPSARLRLAGTWVTAEVAQYLAAEYNLEHIIRPLANAQPESHQPYRRSTKASPQKPATTSSTATASDAHPNKRRKESSPLPVPESAPAPPTPTHVDLRTTTAPRRSGRSTVSPAPSQQSRASRTKPPSKRTAQRVTATSTTTTSTTIVTNGKEPIRLATPAESDAPDYDNDIAEIPGPDISADIAEQKELIAKLKAERDAGKQALDVDTSMDPDEPEDSGSQLKRSREEAEKPLQFDFKEPSSPTTERAIATNSRLRLPRLEPQQKSAAWGALWFAAGLTAAATIPSLFM